MNSTSVKELPSELWLLVKKSNQPAFNNLYDLFWKQMVRKSFNILREEELAQDVVQEIFIDIWERREKLEIQDFGAYVGTATKYKSLAYLKRQKLKVVHLDILEQLSEYPKNDCYEAANELREDIEKAVVKLPSSCQNIFKQSRYLNLSNQEIADKLGISKRTVETQISKALRFLRKQVLNLF